MRAGLGRLQPGRRRPPAGRIDHGEEVDHPAALDGVVQQVRAGPHPELERAGLGQVRQQRGRDQAAESRRTGVDRLVATGHPGPGQRMHAVGAHHQPASNTAPEEQRTRIPAAPSSRPVA